MKRATPKLDTQWIQVLLYSKSHGIIIGNIPDKDCGSILKIDVGTSIKEPDQRNFKKNTSFFHTTIIYQVVAICK